MKAKRTAAVILAGTMVAAALAGCGNSAETSTVTTDSGSGASTGDTQKIVLEYIYFNKVPTDMQLVQDAINAKTVPDIGVEVEFYPVSFGEADTQTSLMISSGEQLDLVVPFGQSAFLSLINKNMLEPLDDLLDQYGDNIKEVDKDTLAGGYVDGKLYGIPSINKVGRTYGYVVRKDILDEVGWTKTEDCTMDDLTELFSKIKAAHPDMNVVQISAGTPSTTTPLYDYFYPNDYLGADPACGGISGGGLDATNTTIENVYKSDNYKKFCETMHEWYQNGYINADAATNTDTMQSAVEAGASAGFFLNTEVDMVPNQTSGIGMEMTAVNTRPHTLMQQDIQGQSMAIPVTSANLEAAMKFMNYMFGSKEMVNLFYYGIEGQDYVINDAGEVAYPDGQNAQIVGYRTVLGLYFDQLKQLTPDYLDTVVRAYAGDSQSNYGDTYSEMCKDYNSELNDRNTSKFLGYTYNPNAVKTQYSSVQSVITQYRPGLETGSVDPDTTIPQFISALEAAGINDIIADNQKSLNDWLK